MPIIPLQDRPGQWNVTNMNGASGIFFTAATWASYGWSEFDG